MAKKGNRRKKESYFRGGVTCLAAHASGVVVVVNFRLIQSDSDRRVQSKLGSSRFL